MSDVRQLHLRGALGHTRTEMVDGREHLIVPVVALMEGVIHAVNAETPERVTTATLIKAANSWNGRPLTLGHPVRNGKQISANDAHVLETQSFGTIFNSRVDGSKLLMDAYIDPIKAEKIGGGAMLNKLRNGEMCEVSVGAFVTTDPVPGEHNGKPYKATWLETTGDHLAFLPNGVGACSINMGCGAHRAASISHLVTAEGIEAITNIKEVGADGNADTATADGEKTADAEKMLNLKNLPKLLADALKTALKTAGYYDTPEEAASEEAAELVKWKTLRTLCDQIGQTYSAMEKLVGELIAAERTQQVDDAAETELEAAKLNAIRVLCMALYSTTNSVMALANVDTAVPADPIRYMAAKTVDCDACGGTGSKDGNPCTMCDGNGHIKTAAGARHSADDRKVIQGVHDHAVSLGADCSPKRMLAATELAATDSTTKDPTIDKPVQSELRAACGCGGSIMNAEQKTEAIKLLVSDKHSGFTDADIKMLEAASDERIEAFRVAAAAREKEVKAAEEKTIADATALADAAAKIKAAESRTLTEEEFMKVAPASLKALIESKQAQDTARKIELVAALKTAQSEYSESELSAMALDTLERTARIAKIESPDYSGRGVPQPRVTAADDKSDVFSNPPDPYAAGLEAMRKREAIN